MRSGGEAETSVAMETPASKCQHWDLDLHHRHPSPDVLLLNKVYLPLHPSISLTVTILPFRGPVVDGVFWFPPPPSPCISISFVTLSLPHRTWFYIPSLSHLTRNKRTSTLTNRQIFFGTCYSSFFFFFFFFVTHHLQACYDIYEQPKRFPTQFQLTSFLNFKATFLIGFCCYCFSKSGKARHSRSKGRQRRGI